MSANRNGTLDPVEITWEEFLARCARKPVCRVQGRQNTATSHTGRLVRFNRSVEVLTNTAEGEGPRRRVHAERVRWCKKSRKFVRIGQRMVVSWRELDWLTWRPTGDPNYSWLKVTT